ASGLLTEQEPREGENSATSFEPHALFTPSAIRGGAYLSLRYGLGVFVSLGNMLVMTRWIGPHPYGLFVTAIGIVAFLSNLARAGVDIYLVRLEPAPDQRIYDIAITLVLFISATLSLLGASRWPICLASLCFHRHICRNPNGPTDRIRPEGNEENALVRDRLHFIDARVAVAHLGESVAGGKICWSRWSSVCSACSTNRR